MCREKGLFSLTALDVLVYDWEGSLLLGLVWGEYGWWSWGAYGRADWWSHGQELERQEKGTGFPQSLMTKGSPTSCLFSESPPPLNSTTMGSKPLTCGLCWKFSMQAITELGVKQMEALCVCGGDVRSPECMVASSSALSWGNFLHRSLNTVMWIQPLYKIKEVSLN